MRTLTVNEELPLLCDDKWIDRLMGIYDPAKTGREFSCQETRALLRTMRDLYEADRWRRAQP